MKTIDGIIRKIDTSKMVSNGVDFYDMCESEFEIYEWLTQPTDNERLTYCYYHSWICTDSMVGIRVWYFDGEPVCISWKPYRKSDEVFGWMSEKCFKKVKKYAFSLKEKDECSIEIISDEIIAQVITNFESISYKSFEKKNIKE